MSSTSTSSRTPGISIPWPRSETHPRHTFVLGDIGDRALVTRLFEEHRPRAIVNFAAESHVDRSIDGPAEFVNTNVVGTFQLLDAARNYWNALPPRERSRFRFLQVSTDEVYGSLGRTGLFTESTPYSPNSPYSASKAACDHFVRAYHHTYGMPTLITNCSNNYGPYQFPEKLIPLMILNAIDGKTLPVYGDGQQIRDWLFVEDHCRAIRCVLSAAPPGRNLQHRRRLRTRKSDDRRPDLHADRSPATSTAPHALSFLDYARRRSAGA